MDGSNGIVSNNVSTGVIINPEKLTENAKKFLDIVLSPAKTGVTPLRRKLSDGTLAYYTELGCRAGSDDPIGIIVESTITLYERCEKFGMANIHGDQIQLGPDGLPLRAKDSVNYIPTKEHVARVQKMTEGLNKYWIFKTPGKLLGRIQNGDFVNGETAFDAVATAFFKYCDDGGFTPTK